MNSYYTMRVVANDEKRIEKSAMSDVLAKRVSKVLPFNCTLHVFPCFAQDK